MKLTNIITQIDTIASEHPDWPAYDELGTVHTYGDLKQASDAIAWAISQRHLARTQPIMVYADQSFMTVAAFLGCVKAGHAYIPVDTHSPNDRLTMIESIAQPGLVLALQPLPIALKTPVFTAEALAAYCRADAKTVGFQPVVGAENFYIIFTSGTTGQPKGVQISHTNLLSFVNWMTDFKLPKRLRCLVQAPYSFDLSVMSLYPTLVNGGTLVVLPRSKTQDLAQLFHWLPLFKLDVWVSTPSMMAMCLLDQTFNAATYPQLKQIFFCGEELTPQLARKILKRFPNVALYNTYGPTEATVAVTAVQITPAILDQYPRLPIGYAKPDTWISLRPGTEQVDHGQALGELLLSGPSISKGYLNRPDKTAQVFKASSYASGDLGYIDAHGLIFYRGRTDFQIKMNGYRIELEEVNHFLNQSKYLKQAVAVPKYNAQQKVTQLIAFAVPADGQTGNIALTKAVKAALAGVMMDYMIPQRFVYRSELPLTQNDKVAIKLLISEVNPA